MFGRRQIITRGVPRPQGRNLRLLPRSGYNSCMPAHSDQPIYLDHAATTPLAPEAAEAMVEAACRYSANPASQHRPGREARRALEEARGRIAELLGARSGPDADAIVFTSGGTEANNLALAGLGEPNARLLISAAEHPSIREYALHQRRGGRPVDVLPLDQQGVVSLNDVRSALVQSPSVGLVSIQLGSNETGVLQPVDQLAKLCETHSALLHTDAVQAIGKIDVDFQRLGVAAMSVGAHKFQGPIGIGVLVVRHGVALAPILRGGFQQAGQRPGTEAVPLAVGMAVALEKALARRQADRDYLTRLGIQLEAALIQGDDQAMIIGADTERLPHVLTIAFRGIDRQALVMALDVAGIACSTGSACASGSSEPSATLAAMGLSEAEIEGSIRLSWGPTTTPTEIDLAARRILSTVNHLRQITSP